jgi:hypothetical protein
VKKPSEILSRLPVALSLWRVMMGTYYTESMIIQNAKNGRRGYDDRFQCSSASGSPAGLIANRCYLISRILT